jgi:hypothetical protein
MGRREREGRTWKWLMSDWKRVLSNLDPPVSVLNASIAEEWCGKWEKEEEGRDERKARELSVPSNFPRFKQSTREKARCSPD